MKLTKSQLVKLIKEEVDEWTVTAGPLQTEDEYWEEQSPERGGLKLPPSKIDRAAYLAKWKAKKAKEKAYQEAYAAWKKEQERVWIPSQLSHLKLDAKAVQDLYDLSEEEYEQNRRDAFGPRKPFAKDTYSPRWDLEPATFWSALAAEEALIEPGAEKLISMARPLPGALPSAASWGSAAAAPALLNPATIAFGSYAIGDWLEDWYKDAKLKGRKRPPQLAINQELDASAKRMFEKDIGVSSGPSWAAAKGRPGRDSASHKINRAANWVGNRFKDMF